MQSEEKRLIEGLFQRLKQTEEKNLATRDVEAEQQIQSFIQKQPTAPYYMTQSLLIQEAALNRLSQKIQQLQYEVNKLKQQNESSKNNSFLSNFFRRRRTQTLSQTQVSTPYAQQNTGTPISSNASSGGGSSFMSGALQTAVGVAGGVVLGNMLTNMFHHTTTKDIVNSIDTPDTSSASLVEENDPLLSQNFDADNLETFNHVSGYDPFDQDEGSNNSNWDSDDYSNDNDGFI